MTTSLPINARILVVDDSQAIGKLVQGAIDAVIDLPVDYAASLAECRHLLNQHRGCYPLAVVDLNLPDAPDGEAVDLALENHLAVIVLTGNIDEKMHYRISLKPISDYIIKQNPGSVETVQRGVQRILRNLDTTVLLVDDSASSRAFLKTLLEIQRLKVLEAPNGKSALDILDRRNDIALVVTDYEMPEMDGIHLTAAVRSRYSSSKMAIVGLTGSQDNFLGVKFLKAGADDIVRKPFLVEEFIGRINNCLDHLDNIRIIEDQAHRDYLTRLYNRRYLFDAGKTLFQYAKNGRVRLGVAMLDIDFFKKINDTYGHECGDTAIVGVARALLATFGGHNLTARMGGEEFCILTVDCRSVEDALEDFRKHIEVQQIAVPGSDALRMTISIGATEILGDNLEDMINRADRALYQAKNAGRNRVVMARAS